MALERPHAMLIGTLVALALAAVLASATVDRLRLTPQRATGSASDRAADGLRAALGSEADPGMVIVTSGRDPVESGVYEVALDVISSPVETNPDVAEVRRGRSRATGERRRSRSTSRTTTPRHSSAVAELREELDPGPLEIQVGGEAAVLRDARDGFWGRARPARAARAALVRVGARDRVRGPAGRRAGPGGGDRGARKRRADGSRWCASVGAGNRSGGRDRARRRDRGLLPRCPGVTGTRPRRTEPGRPRFARRSQPPAARSRSHRSPPPGSRARRR